MAQIGTIQLQSQNDGVVDVPVFETGDSSSEVYEFLRIQTGSGIGFIPVTNTNDATYPFLRVQTQNNGVVAVTDTAGSAIPDTKITRSNDNANAGVSDKHGVVVNPNFDLDGIKADISSQTANVSTAYIEETGGTILDMTDVSGLSSGDTFELNASLLSGTDYYLLLDNGGSSYTTGYLISTSFPYTGDAFDVTDGIFDNNSLGSNFHNVNNVRNLDY
jgi:hypothetical protein